MPQLAENISERLVLKAHSSTTYDPTTEPVPASDPAASGGQIWRFLDHNLSLARTAFNTPEMRPDQQQPIDKTGSKSVPATVNCALSCASHKLPIGAVLRGSWSGAAIEIDNTDMTSVAADNSDSTFTFAGGDPVTEGLRVGMIGRFVSLSEAGNNGVNYMIIGFSGGSNRVMQVYPAPTDMTADSAFTFATVGRSVFAPVSSLVRSKYAVEVYNEDSDLAKLFTEIAFGGLSFAAAPNADIRIGFTGMGRNRFLYSGGSAPFFTSPTAAPTTGLISAMDGLIRYNGATVGGFTGLNINFARPLSAPAQIKSDGLAAGVVPTGNAVISGDMTAFELDHTLHDLCDAKTEFEILAYLPATPAAAAHAMSIFLPRVKITNMVPTIIDGAKAQQCTLSMGVYDGSGAGIQATSLFIHDTQVS